MSLKFFGWECNYPANQAEEEREGHRCRGWTERSQHRSRTGFRGDTKTGRGSATAISPNRTFVRGPTDENENCLVRCPKKSLRPPNSSRPTGPGSRLQAHLSFRRQDWSYSSPKKLLGSARLTGRYLRTGSLATSNCDEFLACPA